MNTAAPPLIVLGGPTATGKTTLAIDLALAFTRPGRPVEVISADSRQVYRGMDIATAKPTQAERRGVPHHGLDLVEPDAAFSVADFARFSARVLADLNVRGGVALLVGGTGFWLRAVADGLALDELPSDPATRVRLEKRLVEGGLERLVADLSLAAPRLAARIDLRNPRRVVRALEIAELEGDRPLPVARGYPGPVLRLGLRLEPPTNRAWIEQRAADQIERGLVNEAAALRARYPEHLPSFSAIGYREAFAVLDGALDAAGLLAANIARNTALARRQRTWFRAQPGFTWLDAATAPFQLAHEVAGAFLGAL